MPILAEIADFDNDGWKDIFVSRGHVNRCVYGPRSVEQPNTVFRISVARSSRR